MFYTKSKKYFCLLKITVDFSFSLCFRKRIFGIRKKEKVNRNKIEKRERIEKKGKERKKEREERKIRDKKAEYGKKKRTPYL